MYDDFTPAPGRNIVYAYPEDKAEWSAACAEQRPYNGPIAYRPAQIVRVFSTEGAKTINLVVLLDGSNDQTLDPSPTGVDSIALLRWKTSVMIAGFGEGVNNVHRYLPRVPETAA